MPLPRHCRHRPRRLLILPVFWLATAAFLPAAAPRPPDEKEEGVKKPQIKKVSVGEEEEGGGAAKKKIAVEEPGAAKAAAAPLRPPDVQLDEVIQAAGQARSAAVKAFLTPFAVPFDTLAEIGKAPVRVRPVPLHYATDRFNNPFGVVEYDDGNRAGEARAVKTQDVKSVVPFEEAALSEANRFLRARDAAADAGPGERLAAAEAVLAGALRYHDWARERNKRLGKGWAKVRPPLADRLREVRLDQFKAAAGGGDAAAAAALAGRLMTLYPRDAAVLKEVAAVRLREAEGLLRDGTPADLERLRDALVEFEANYPGGGGDVVRRIRGGLTSQAQKLFAAAQQETGRKNAVAARDLLRKAEALDPALPGLRDLLNQLKSGYPILYVGVQQLPVRMSPAAARTDSERYAVELLFEGLYEELPDGRGGTAYHPALAAGPAEPSGNGRALAAARGVEWATPDKAVFQAHDIGGTLRLLRSRPELGPFPAAEWWAEPLGSEAPGRVTMTLRQGHPDPRALLTFKLLPARWFAERGKGVDDGEFARQPLGTGPFRFDGARPGAGGGPGEAVFTDNPLYGRRPGKIGLPTLREVRLVEHAKMADPIGEMKAGRLHVLPDVPTAGLDRFLGPATGLANTFAAATVATHRRVHVLAVNHRRPMLQSNDLRRGLSLALDREAILNLVFRAGRPEHHAAMTGPFPPRSWATPTASGSPLMNRDLALAKLDKYRAAGGGAEVSLAYPDDDPLAAAACERIRQQVESLFKDSGVKGLAVAVVGLKPRDFVQSVQVEHRFDLAYVPFDYPDDWFHLGLGAFLDPSAAGREGRNYLGYLAPGTNPNPGDLLLRQRLTEARGHCDLAGRLVPAAHEIHKLFDDAMPFIPLWQLDRHMIFAKGVKVVLPDSPEPVSPGVLNPLLLFQGVARWRLE